MPCSTLSGYKTGLRPTYVALLPISEFTRRANLGRFRSRVVQSPHFSHLSSIYYSGRETIELRLQLAKWSFKRGAFTARAAPQSRRI